MAITTEFVLNYLKTEGAVHAGVATPETLKGGPPSTDLSYVMPSARSAIVYALPLELDNIPPYLGKKDRLSFETDYIRKSSLGDGIAVKLANLLKATGSPSVPLAVNEVYREGPPEDKKFMYPDIGLRYLAAASGVGFLGFSGNLLTHDYGPAVILGGLLTEAKLEPTKPLDKSENYCDHYACLQCCETCPPKMLNDNMDLVTNTSTGKRKISWDAGLFAWVLLAWTTPGNGRPGRPGVFHCRRPTKRLPVWRSSTWMLFKSDPSNRAGDITALCRITKSTTSAPIVRWSAYPTRKSAGVASSLSSKVV